MDMLTTNWAEQSTERRPASLNGATLQCVIKDRSGRRIVMPRYTPGDAIEQIANAFVGRNASAEQKRHAWEHLRDHQGFTIEWIQARTVRSKQ